MARFGTWASGGMAAVAAASVLAGCTVSVDATPESQESVERAAPEDANTVALRERAGAFGDLLQGIRGMSKEEACYELQFFVQPSASLRQQVLNYYADFNAKSEKFAIVSQSVAGVSVGTDGTTAEVTYEMVAEGPGGARIPAEQVTQWRKVDGEWYRTMDDPEKRIR